MVEESVKRMGSFFLQRADPVNFFLEIAVIVATEVTSPVVFQPLPVQNCFLLNSIRNQLVALVLLQSKFLVYLLYLVRQLFDIVLTIFAGLAGDSTLVRVLQKVVNVIEEIGCFGLIGNDHWLGVLELTLFCRVFEAIVALGNVGLADSTAEVFKILFLLLHGFGFIVGPLNGLLFDGNDFLFLLNVLILNRNITILLHPLFIYAIFILVLEGIAARLAFADLSRRPRLFVLFQFFPILLYECLEIHFRFIPRLHYHFLPLIHILQDHSKTLLDLHGEAVGLRVIL